MGRRVERTRNFNTWTEAQFWSRIRSALRRISMYWKPAQEAKNRRRRTVKGKRHKFEYQCEECNGWFVSKSVEIDHIEDVGSLRCSEDLKGFVDRLFPEDLNAYQILCKDKCHRNKTNTKRKVKS